MIENPVLRTAVHERWHAVAAAQLGTRFQAVEMKIWKADGFWRCVGRRRGAELPELAAARRLWALAADERGADAVVGRPPIGA